MSVAKAGLASGLVGGALDILAAVTIYPAVYPGATWMGVLHSVASGAIGRDAARAGGMETAMLGLALHMAIALVYGFVLAVAMSRVEISRRLWPITGAIFGVAVYFFMQKVVLPLSAIGPGPGPDAKGLAIGIAIHILLFGVPMAFVARRLLAKG